MDCATIENDTLFPYLFREFTETLARKKQLLDIEVQEKLAEFTRLRQSDGSESVFRTL